VSPSLKNRIAGYAPPALSIVFLSISSFILIGCDWLFFIFASFFIIKDKIEYQAPQTNSIDPSGAKIGGAQSQGAKGKAEVCYCNPSATPDLGASDFPGRVKK
jgi:hypothetical protein